MNIFSEKELKALFWKLAIQIHPDTSENFPAGEGFIKLKSDFDDSQPLLKTQRESFAPVQHAYSRKRFI